MSNPLLGVLIYVAGLTIIFVELFVPSGGILGVIGALCTLYGTWKLFVWSPWAGLIVLIVTGIYVYAVIKLWAKKVTMSVSLGTAKGGSTEVKPSELSGKEGRTLTPLRPSGFALIEGKRLQVVSDTSFIGKGEAVRVVESSGNRVLVTKTEEEPAGEAGTD